jgi:hypothetical protein
LPAPQLVELPADATQDARIKAAREMARAALGLYFRAGVLRSGAEQHNEARMVRIELQLAQTTRRQLSNHALEYLDRRLLEKEKTTAASPSKRGRRPYIVRDLFIMSVISAIRTYGILPRRSVAARDDGRRVSGCSIVAEVLGELGINLTERGVEEVWSRLHVPPKEIPCFHFKNGKWVLEGLRVGQIAEMFRSAEGPPQV